jgi:aryl-alcohol dehydrogenase-like predicted oxidoreductase
MNKTTSKLALGSANFGLDYGLANKSGKISVNDLADILLFAQEAGIDVVDTAQAYGDSEARIGSLCGDGQFNIVTKIGVGLEKKFVDHNAISSVKQSCRRLNQSQLYAVMLHRPEVLLGSQGSAIARELQTLKEQGVITKIGISIYSPEIIVAISKLFKLDIVQVPFNIFDQQILSSGWSEKLKRNGVEIHTRSVFLQGLLLMKRSSLPEYFVKHWPTHFDAWYKFLNESKADALNVALKFALKQDWIDKIVVGVDSVSQLKALVEIEKTSVSIDFPLLKCDNPNLINPSKWNLV